MRGLPTTAGVTFDDLAGGRTTGISRLEAIAAYKRLEVAAAKNSVPFSFVRERAEKEGSPRDFIGALRAATLTVIAEIKRASPAAGKISDNLNAAALAQRYVAGGANALSVWTDARFFNGHPDLLQEARAAVPVPVLRKDFILEPYQVYESRAIGSDAVLLIAALLEVPELRDLIDLCAHLGMVGAVDVHRESDVDRAVTAGAKAILIHNRDVGTFEVDLGKTLRFRPRIPPSILVISESGIMTPADVALLRDQVDAILVGTALMASEDPEATLKTLQNAGRDA